MTLNRFSLLPAPKRNPSTQKRSSKTPWCWNFWDSNRNLLTMKRTLNQGSSLTCRNSCWNWEMGLHLCHDKKGFTWMEMISLLILFFITDYCSALSSLRSKPARSPIRISDSFRCTSIITTDMKRKITRTQPSAYSFALTKTIQ